MEVLKEALKATVVTYVHPHNCPLLEGARGVTLEKCYQCPYYYSENGVMYVAWSEYKLSENEVKKKTDYDEDDGSGALPCNTYFWMIPCALCRSEITFSSGFSTLVKGDSEACFMCKTIHTFIERNIDSSYVFAIPFK